MMAPLAGGQGKNIWSWFMTGGGERRRDSRGDTGPPNQKGRDYSQLIHWEVHFFWLFLEEEEKDRGRDRLRSHDVRFICIVSCFLIRGAKHTRGDGFRTRFRPGRVEENTEKSGRERGSKSRDWREKSGARKSINIRGKRPRLMRGWPPVNRRRQGAIIMARLLLLFRGFYGGIKGVGWGKLESDARGCN